jgi:hypothetical protein
MLFNTEEVDITFSTEDLVYAENNDLNVYCPVGEDDEILYQEAYWASEPRNPQDIDLECHPCGFGFSSGDQDCLEQPNHYVTLELPKTAIEYRALKRLEVCESHISCLLNNGCDLEEARLIATSHLTGVPTTFLKM